MKKYPVIVSDPARRMIERHYRFLLQTTPQGAEKMKTALLTSLKSLAELPERHPFLQSPYLPRNKYRKMVVEQRYLVLYQIHEDNVFVDLVIDGREDYQWLLMP